jgi:outer membrane protein assembly factor BamB
MLAALVAAGPAHARSTTFQADAAHTGNVHDPGLAGALDERWSRSIGELASYPLVADGRVFVGVARRTAPYRVLFALDAATGALLWWRP